MPARREMKKEARELIRTTKPHPCFTGLVFVLIIWLISYLTAKINGGPIELDMKELYAGNINSAFRLHMYEPNFLSSLLVTAFQFITTILGFGFTAYAVKVSRKRPADIGTLFDGFAMFFRVIWMYIIIAVYVFLWSLLFIIPGFVASYKYAMAPYLLIDHPEWRAIDCIRESKRIMKGHKAELFVLDISFIGWYILSLIRPLQVYIQPFSRITHAIYYNNLVGYKEAAPLDPSENSDKKPWEY